MVVEVGYQTKKDAADPQCHVKRTEYFESATMPSKAAIARKLSRMHKNFAAHTIEVTRHKKDGVTMRRAGFRVTKL